MSLRLQVKNLASHREERPISWNRLFRETTRVRVNRRVVRQLKGQMGKIHNSPVCIKCGTNKRRVFKNKYHRLASRRGKKKGALAACNRS